MSEVIIIGSGPAGYTAGVYLARARLAPVLFAGREIGGQLMYTTEVENYPGFAAGVPGQDLMMQMRQQAERFGTTIIDDLVTRLEKIEHGWRVWQGDTPHDARAVIIATGAKARMLGLPNEPDLIGRGLSTCAVCDAAFYRDKIAYVVGGGDSAMEDTLALTKFAQEVHVIHRRESFRASRIMQERVLNHPKVKVWWHSALTQINVTDGAIASVVITNTQTGAREERPAQGVFYAIGHVPSTEFVREVVQLNDEGYIVTHLGLDAASVAQAQASAGTGKVPYLTLTTAPGIFAAGDCVDFRYRQAITAAAFGTMAALDVERYLESVASVRL